MSESSMDTAFGNFMRKLRISVQVNRFKKLYNWKQDYLVRWLFKGKKNPENSRDRKWSELRKSVASCVSLRAAHYLWASKGKPRYQRDTPPLFRIFLYWSNISDWYRRHQFTIDCHFTSTGGHCPPWRVVSGHLSERCGVLAARPKFGEFIYLGTQILEKGQDQGVGRETICFYKDLKMCKTITR